MKSLEMFWQSMPNRTLVCRWRLATNNKPQLAMNQARAKTVSAILAASVTLSGLKGIAVLAEATPSPQTPVVVLPSVTVYATGRHDATPVAGVSEVPNQFVASTTRSDVH